MSRDMSERLRQYLQDSRSIRLFKSRWTPPSGSCVKLPYLCYMGGLRMAELRNLTLGSVKFETEGAYVTFVRAKARGEEKTDQFLVPYDKANPHICFVAPVAHYIDCVTASLPHLRPEDPLFHRPLTKGFGKKGQVMGVNMLRTIGKEVAKELGMENPNRYTGHCFRRSSATEAANKGATSIDMKRAFGWKQEHTALKYLDDTKERPRKMAELLSGIKLNSVPDAKAESAGMNEPAPVLPASSGGATMTGELTQTTESTPLTPKPERSASGTASAAMVSEESAASGTTSAATVSRESAQDGQKIFHFHLSGAQNFNLYFS